MRLFIMTDLEGASGVSGPKEELDPRTGRKFAEACANLTHDVNAEVEGAIEAGAEDVVVLDGAGRRFTILRNLLHPRAGLLQGARAGELTGLDESFEAMFVIGAHAMAGTPDGVLNHTFSSRLIHNVWLNGRQCGEVEILAAWTGQLGIPLVLVSGDRAATEEVRPILPDTELVAVKDGMSQDYARLRPAGEVAAMLRAAAKRAVEKRSRVAPYRVPHPVEIQIEFLETQTADRMARRPGAKRVDGRTVKAKGETIADALALLLPW